MLPYSHHMYKVYKIIVSTCSMKNTIFFCKWCGKSFRLSRNHFGLLFWSVNVYQTS